MTVASTPERELTISRVIDAPRPLVFRAFTEARHLTQWFGPEGYRVTTYSFDFSPGGGWVFILHSPNGANHSTYIRWREIAAPARLAFENGRYAGDSKDFEATVTFAEQGAATEVTLRGRFNTQELRDRMVREFNAIEGGKQCLTRLAAYVADPSKLSKKGT